MYRRTPMPRCDCNKAAKQLYWNQTSEWSFIKKQMSGTSSDNEWERVTTSGTTSDNEWYNEWQRMTTSDNEWYNKWQRVTTNDNKWYNEWQQVVQQVATSDNRWHQMTRSDNEWQFWPNFLFSNNILLVWAVLHFITPEVTADSSNRCIQNLCRFIKEYYCGIS